MSKIRRFNNFDEHVSENIDNVEEFISNENEAESKEVENDNEDLTTDEDTSKIDDTDLSQIGKIEEEEEEVKAEEEEEKTDSDEEKDKEVGKTTLTKQPAKAHKEEKAKEEEEIQDFSAYNSTPPVQSSCKILVINGSEDDEKVDSTTSSMKETMGCDCDEIHLYQLNIKDSNAEKEPKDGMEFIYNKLDECDGLVLACDSMTDSMKSVLKRLKKHYTEGELKNKILGVVANKESDVTELILTGMELGMILCGDCFCDIKDTTSTESVSCATAMLNLCNATVGLRGSITKSEEELKDYDSYENSDMVDYQYAEDENETDELDDIKDDVEVDELADLKKEVSDELAIPFEEEEADKTEEEEERLIDNLDGSITHIHGDDKDHNQKFKVENDDDKIVSEEEESVKEDEDKEEKKPNIPEEEQTLPFSSFDRKDMWKEYKESKSEKTFEQYCEDCETAKELEDELHPDMPMDYDEYSQSMSVGGDEAVDMHGTPVKFGDTVRIDRRLTSDPLEKQGQEGVVVRVTDDTVYVLFDDMEYPGKYNFGTFEIL
jgi:multimeric flavodoxin WrbA